MNHGLPPHAPARRKSVVGAALVLAGLGMGLGAIASTVTASARKPLGPMSSGSVATVPAASGDALAAARAWARDAYPFGLRDCPRVTDDYYAACMDQMRQEARAAAEDRSARARWAVAEPAPVYVPEPVAPDALIAAEPDADAVAEPAPIPIGMPLPEDLDSQVEVEVSSPPAG